MKIVLKKLRIPQTNQTATESVDANVDIEFELQVIHSKFTKGWDLDVTKLVVDEYGEGKFVVDGVEKSMEFLTAGGDWKCGGWMNHPTLGNTFMYYRFAEGTTKLTGAAIHPGVGWPTRRGNNRGFRKTWNKMMG